MGILGALTTAICNLRALPIGPVSIVSNCIKPRSIACQRLATSFMTMLIVSSAAALGTILGSAAIAADMPVKARPMTPAAAWSWTGFYLGAEAGYGWGQSGLVVTDPPGTAFNVGDTINSASLKGPLGGFVAGADYQFGQWLAGLKGGYSWADISGGSKTQSTAFPALHVTFDQKIEWVATFVGRVGYLPSPDWLVYATAGGAWAGSKRAGSFVVTATNAVTATSRGNETLAGWTVGVGTEYRLNQRWSVVLEYNYLDFGTSSVTNLILTGPTTGTINKRNMSTDLHLMKAGLNWRF